MVQKTDSVAKGGSSVAIARVIGMGFSFLLFILLARQSPESAGTFRTVLTYIIIAEFLGMLGLHRWLAAEIATLKEKRWALFLATNAFTLIVSLILVILYTAISYSDIYGHEVKAGLILGALSVIPSGVLACTQSALVGIGQSHFLGKLNLLENLIRCAIAIALVWLEQSVNMIIAVFVITRWCIAIYGFTSLKKMLGGTHWHIDKTFITQIKQAAPKFALIIGAFLLLRNAGLLTIPALSTLTEAGRYAVSYQLYDLMLILPSVLAMTTINLFSNKAVSSRAGLKNVAMKLTMITSIIIFPLIAITAAFSQHFLTLLYGDRYIDGHQTLMILMLAAAFSVIDIVLSQIMQAKKQYNNDLISVLAAGVVAAIATLYLTKNLGANGAAYALAVALFVNIGVRVYLLRNTFPLTLLLLSLWRPALASGVVFITTGYCGCLSRSFTISRLFSALVRSSDHIVTALIIFCITTKS
jgi:O-antigen/teichoic acid export membrane protein